MSASRLFPKVYQGREDSSGYLAKNDRPTSRSSPGWRGRIYVAEPGWHWLSGWLVHPREAAKPMLNVKLRGLTDQEAHQYCAPRGHDSPSPAAAQNRSQPATGERQSAPPANDFTGDDDIPF